MGSETGGGWVSNTKQLKSTLGISVFQARSVNDWNKTQSSDQKCIPECFRIVQQTASNSLTNVGIGMHFLVTACDINMKVRCKASAMHLNESSDVVGSVEDQCAPNNVSQALKSASVGAIGLQKQLGTA